MTDERTRLLAEKARIEAEHPDKCFTDGVRQLAEIIREQRTANWLSVAAVLDHCAENIDRLHAAAPQPSAELAKLDAEPDWGPAAKAFWQGAYPGHDDMHPTTEAEVIRGLIAAAPLIPRDAGVTDDGDDEGPCTDCWDTGETQNERECPCGAGRTAPLMPAAAMTDAEIEGLAQGYVCKFLGFSGWDDATDYRLTGKQDWERDQLYDLMKHTIRETLKRAPQVRWPGEAVKALEQIANNNWRDQSRAKIVAREALVHLTGEGK